MQGNGTPTRPRLDGEITVSGLAPAVARAWSFLSLEKTARLGVTEAAYPDELGVRYVYDTRVAHHADVHVGDLAVIRDDKVVLGAGWIDDIQIATGYKIRQRCPVCHSTNYKLRFKSRPPYRCAACSSEFEQTDKKEVSVRTYTADYSRTWRPADSMFPVGELSSAYVARAAQHSIRQLDTDRLRSLLGGHLVISDLWWDREDRPGPPGGYKTSPGKTRQGQQRFREEMLGRFGGNCAFTGPRPPESLEAAHLYAYSKSPHHDLRGGLLLRRDLHALFDRELITIDPDSWTIDVAPSLAGYPDIHALQGRPLQVPVGLWPRKNYVQDHAASARASWPHP